MHFCSLKSMGTRLKSRNFALCSAGAQKPREYQLKRTAAHIVMKILLRKNKYTHAIAIRKVAYQPRMNKGYSMRPLKTAAKRRIKNYTHE